MTGPEHYREAERLLDGPSYESYVGDPEGYERDRRDNLAAAQVHATLALAAAHVDTLGEMGQLNVQWQGATA